MCYMVGCRVRIYPSVWCGVNRLSWNTILGGDSFYKVFSGHFQYIDVNITMEFLIFFIVFIYVSPYETTRLLLYRCASQNRGSLGLVFWVMEAPCLGLAHPICSM